ncbi:tellurite resistance TerB family protein [Frigidibacter sp. ROC022]|uniref:tellurite resistance TerB family protein n=1 Tax=Frigidibacter sp. ROC022 TaxID=2971796 RepID=UPI00215A305D|nr:TerB family tellurite resistance protein [Frigidibacter sp. ROC022]MCR8723071.1 TerB family tellurite resistance protein [Frigidibacter sp. ROC022]
MFADLLRRLTAPAPSPLAPPDARLALTALLVRVARADNNYTAAERERIDRVMIAREGFGEAEAAALRAEAEVLEAEAPDTVRFTRAIKDAVPLIDRVRVLEALWDVALADGNRDHQEDMALRLVANLLGVSDVDSGLARQRVEARRR